jgi:hypothetical protein
MEGLACGTLSARQQIVAFKSQIASLEKELDHSRQEAADFQELIRHQNVECMASHLRR